MNGKYSTLFEGGIYFLNQTTLRAGNLIQDLQMETFIIGIYKDN